jgi:hypothetical protein
MITMSTMTKDDMAALGEALKKRLTPEQIEAVIEHLTVPRQSPDRPPTRAILTLITISPTLAAPPKRAARNAAPPKRAARKSTRFQSGFDEIS